jgi:hypothetical protein
MATQKELEEVIINLTTHLMAAESLLTEQNELLAKSKRDPFFKTRQKDFRKAIETGRAILGYTNKITDWE